jgi:hypothetical protein
MVNSLYNRCRLLLQYSCQNNEVGALPAPDMPPASGDGVFPLIIVPDNCDFDIFYQNIRGPRMKCSDFIDNVFATYFKTYCITET